MSPCSRSRNVAFGRCRGGKHGTLPLLPPTRSFSERVTPVRSAWLYSRPTRAPTTLPCFCASHSTHVASFPLELTFFLFFFPLPLFGAAVFSLTSLISVALFRLTTHMCVCLPPAQTALRSHPSLSTNSQSKGAVAPLSLAARPLSSNARTTSAHRREGARARRRSDLPVLTDLRGNHV